MRVLLVDDNPELLDLISRALSRDGHVVDVAQSLAGARQELERGVADLLILDLALPDGSGITLCEELRQQNVQLPILMLTAHGEVAQRVAGLDAGADDFLAKPFAMAELRARLRALSRRLQVQRPSVVTVADVRLDFGARRALRGALEVPFTAREWAILELLASQPERTFDRHDILETVWGEDTEASSASLDVLMARVRRKLGPAGVRTVRGKGYALAATSADAT